MEPTVIKAPGHPADVILDTASREGVSLVVLGSRGLSGVRALGSVSERVAHPRAARCWSRGPGDRAAAPTAGTMASDKLTPLDATFLELEEADDSAHMHIGSLMTFEADAGRPPTIARVRRHLARRLSALPRYQCRLSAAHTGGLRWPAWVPDPDFHIAAHVRHSKLPAPGDEANCSTGWRATGRAGSIARAHSGTPGW